MTLTGKRPPNRDPELQRTELVQDTQALMVQDTQALMVQDTKALMVQDTKALMVQDAKALMVQDTKVDIVSPSDKVKRRETEVIYISCSDRLTDRQ